MRLEIKKEYDQSFTKDTGCLAVHMLALKATHLFIASNLWEAIRIELDDTIPEGALKSINTVCNDIKVKLPDTITDTTLRQLVDLYPGKAAALRRSYMKGESLKGVLLDDLWSD